MKLCKHSANVLTIAVLTNHTIYWCRSCGAIKDMYELCDEWELPYSQIPKGVQFNNNFFSGNEPGVVLKTDKTLSEEQYQELAKIWGERHRGVEKAKEIEIVEKTCRCGLPMPCYKPSCYTPEDED